MPTGRFVPPLHRCLFLHSFIWSKIFNFPISVYVRINHIKPFAFECSGFLVQFSLESLLFCCLADPDQSIVRAPLSMT